MISSNSLFEMFSSVIIAAIEWGVEFNINKQIHAQTRKKDISIKKLTQKKSRRRAIICFVVALCCFAWYFMLFNAIKLFQMKKSEFFLLLRAVYYTILHYIQWRRTIFLHHFFSRVPFSLSLFASTIYNT